MKIIITGGDGFCGWPTSLHLSHQGHEILIVDNKGRRKIETEISASSLVPIYSIEERLDCWKMLTGNVIEFQNIDLANPSAQFTDIVKRFRPDCVVHLAAQRSAPYSMSTQERGRYTLNNNIISTHNIISSLIQCDCPARMINLGSIGVYGYDEDCGFIPESQVDFSYTGLDQAVYSVTSKFPHDPTSLYHTSKSMNNTLLAFYAKRYGIPIIDLMQGIVWGTQTDWTSLHPKLANRFDYDQYFGTVVNRFIVQSNNALPLTVYGKGLQTRGFIHLRDTVRCIEAALYASVASQTVQCFHQVTETKTVYDVARLVSGFTGASIEHVINPRHENEDHIFNLQLNTFSRLNLRLSYLAETLEDEIKFASSYANMKPDTGTMNPTVSWQRGGIS